MPDGHLFQSLECLSFWYMLWARLCIRCLCFYFLKSEYCCRYGQDSLLVSCHWNTLAKLQLPRGLVLLLVHLEGFWLRKYPEPTDTETDVTQNTWSSLLVGTNDVDIFLDPKLCLQNCFVNYCTAEVSGAASETLFCCVPSKAGTSEDELKCRFVIFLCLSVPLL